MARYIDLDKAIERIEGSPAFPNMGMDGYFLRDVVCDLLKKQPAADVAPKSMVAFWMDAAANAKKEAIKEFAERLKQKQTSVCAGHGMSCDVIYAGHIDALVKEMTGGDENG